MNGITGRAFLLMPNAVRQRRNALPQTRSERSRFRPILRQQIVENNDGSGQLPDLVGFLVERTVRGCDQQAQYQRSQCADQACCHSHNVLRVGLQMAFRQQRSKKHPQHRAAKYDCKCKERDLPRAHRSNISVHGVAGITALRRGRGIVTAAGSVHPAANNHSPPRCDNPAPGDHGAACANAACAMDAASTHDGTCLHRAQCDEAACQK
jgi:hypothetical protein